MAKLVIPMRAHVNAPVQKVFDYIADLTKHPEWATNPLTIEPLKGETGTVGARYGSKAIFMRKKVEAEQEVTVSEPPSHFVFESSEHGQVYTHEYTLRPEGNGTLVERVITTDVPGVRGVTMKIALAMLAPGLTKKNIARLKQNLES